MRKTSFLFFIFFIFLTACLFAQNGEIAWNYENKNQNTEITPDKDIVWVFDIAEKKETVEKKETIGIKDLGSIRIPNRISETGILNFNLGISNDFMAAADFLKEKVSIDLDKLAGGFNFNFNSYLSPVFFNYNKKDVWGYGISTGLDFFGNIGLNGSMLTFHEASSVNSDFGAALFAEVNVHGFLTFKKFKIKVKPAVYYPILYMVPDNFSYTYVNKKANDRDETYLNMELDLRIYTPFPMDKDYDFKDIFNVAADITDTIKNISSKPGIDISVGAEYPLSDFLGLTEKISFLDFDVGIDIINIPFYPSEMEDYVKMIVNLGNGDEPIDFFGGMLSGDSEGIDMDNFFNIDKGDPAKGKRKILRPFKTLISIKWRPFGSPLKADSKESDKLKREWLTFTPIFGFAVNPLYNQQVSFEGGLKTRFDFANFFIAALNIGYYDRLWKNTLDLAINLRLIEVDMGVSVQSADFLKSWSGGGIGASFGLKFGW
jgi:hypothetical protein